MATNNLRTYLEKKYGKDYSKKVLDKYDNQKQKYVEQGKR
jgi:hypothetical protein